MTSLRAGAASETRKGPVELATDAETLTGTDTERATTPANVASAYVKNTGGTFTGAVTIGDATSSAKQLTVKGGASGGPIVSLERTVGATLTYDWSLASSRLSFRNLTTNDVTIQTGKVDPGIGESVPLLIVGFEQGSSSSTAGANAAIKGSTAGQGTADLTGGNVNILGGRSTGNATPGTIDFWTTTTGVSGTTPQSYTKRATLAMGFVVGAPTGGDPGAGGINAEFVQDDSVTLTDIAQDFLVNGKFDDEDVARWDAKVPDQVIPERIEEVPEMEEIEDTIEEIVKESGAYVLRRKQVMVSQPKTREVPVLDEQGVPVTRVTREAEPEVRDFRGRIVSPAVSEEREPLVIHEPIVTKRTIPAQIIQRTHGLARLFKKMVDEGFDPRDPQNYLTRLRTDHAMPGLPTEAEWNGKKFSLGELSSRERLAMEFLALAFNGLTEKCVQLETRIAALEVLRR